MSHTCKLKGTRQVKYNIPKICAHFCWTLSFAGYVVSSGAFRRLNFPYSSWSLKMTQGGLLDSSSASEVNFNTLGLRQNGRYFADNIFKCIFFNENVWISIKISLTFVPKGPIYNIPALVQIMAWHRSGDKPLSEAMMVNLPRHICVTRPQWVKDMFWNMLLSNQNTRGLFYQCGLTLIPAWISNHTQYTMWDEITHPFPIFSGATVEVWSILKLQWCNRWNLEMGK